MNTLLGDMPEDSVWRNCPLVGVSQRLSPRHCWVTVDPSQELAQKSYNELVDEPWRDARAWKFDYALFVPWIDAWNKPLWCYEYDAERHQFVSGATEIEGKRFWFERVAVWNNDQCSRYALYDFKDKAWNQVNACQASFQTYVGEHLTFDDSGRLRSLATCRPAHRHHKHWDVWEGKSLPARRPSMIVGYADSNYRTKPTPDVLEDT